jgi:hypothetical protein
MTEETASRIETCVAILLLVVWLWSRFTGV